MVVRKNKYRENRAKALSLKNVWSSLAIQIYIIFIFSLLICKLGFALSTLPASLNQATCRQNSQRLLSDAENINKQIPALCQNNKDSLMDKCSADNRECNPNKFGSVCQNTYREVSNLQKTLSQQNEKMCDIAAQNDQRIADCMAKGEDDCTKETPEIANAAKEITEEFEKQKKELKEKLEKAIRGNQNAISHYRETDKGLKALKKLSPESLDQASYTEGNFELRAVEGGVDTLAQYDLKLAALVKEQNAAINLARGSQRTLNETLYSAAGTNFSQMAATSSGNNGKSSSISGTEVLHKSSSSSSELADNLNTTAKAGSLGLMGLQAAQIVNNMNQNKNPAPQAATPPPPTTISLTGKSAGTPTIKELLPKNSPHQGNPGPEENAAAPSRKTAGGKMGDGSDLTANSGASKMGKGSKVDVIAGSAGPESQSKKGPNFGEIEAGKPLSMDADGKEDYQKILSSLSSPSSSSSSSLDSGLPPLPNLELPKTLDSAAASSSLDGENLPGIGSGNIETSAQGGREQASIDEENTMAEKLTTVPIFLRIHYRHVTAQKKGGVYSGLRGLK